MSVFKLRPQTFHGMLGMPQSAALVQAAYILQSRLGPQMEPGREVFQELCGLCWSY